MACARCHDHKFDAISTKDYYALFGFLRSSRYRLAAFDIEGPNRQVAAQLAEAADRQAPRVREALAAAIEPQIERNGRLSTGRARSLARCSPRLFIGRKLAEKGQGLSRGLPRAGRSIANVHGVDADRLADWVEYLLAAQKNPADPLHLWAVLARDRRRPTPPNTGAKSSIKRSVMAREERSGCRGDEISARDCRLRRTARRRIGSRMVSRSEPDRLRPGDVTVSGTQEQPAIEIATHARPRKIRSGTA